MRDHRSSSITGIFARLAFAVAAYLAAAGSRAEVPPVAPTASPVLHLMDGGFVAGDLRDTDKPGVLRWQGTSFVEPFEFFVNGVNTVHYPYPTHPPEPVGVYGFDLSGGDVLFGTLVSLDETEAVIDEARAGRLHVRRADVRRLYRRGDNAEQVYVGPNGLTGWLGSRKGWRDEAGELASDQEGSTIRGDFKLPTRASVEFEFSWKTKPDFVLTLGGGDGDKGARGTFRFEVWENDLVVVRETDKEADVASVLKLGEGPARVHLRVYLDQERGRILVESANGDLLADLTATDRKPEIRDEVLLANRRGDLRVERLRVLKWNGDPPRGLTVDRSKPPGGAILNGQVVRYDADAKVFVVREGEGETRVPADKISTLTVSRSEATPSRPVRIALHDGTRLSGDLLKVEKGAVWLSSPGIKETLKLPVNGLQSIAVLQHVPRSLDAPASKGRLEIDGVKLNGRLANARETPDASCLAWLPLEGSLAGRLRPGVSGRIVYKEPPPTMPTVAANPGMMMPGGGVVFVQNGVAVRRPQGAQQVGGLQGFVRGFASSRPLDQLGKRSLYLRTGDKIPSEVTKIDETGVTFRTPLSDGTFVPHEKIKAVELAAENVLTVRLNKSKRDRLLTLPRMQKGSPPTHLIRSKNGDYLRGRVVGMDDKTIQVEVRLEVKELPRDRVSRIIWLHPEETVDPKNPAPAKPPVKYEATRVQAVRTDGIRLTFDADVMENATLSGKSDVLGKCRVQIEDVDQLLIGGAIEKEAARLAYQQWKLTNAEEPKVAQGEGGGSSGTESVLVGKAAPDFELETLAGKKFHLADSKGKVVMLDFWATWCGPCMQAMPQVEKVAHEFEKDGLQLIAVNLQESAKEITAMLERHKLTPAVALDRDGVVAEKYGATAIPQTVIIDREGKIVRLFVGGGPHLDDQLREAIRTLIPGPDAKEPKK